MVQTQARESAEIKQCHQSHSSSPAQNPSLFKLVEYM